MTDLIKYIKIPSLQRFRAEQIPFTFPDSHILLLLNLLKLNPGAKLFTVVIMQSKILTKVPAFINKLSVGIN